MFKTQWTITGVMLFVLMALSLPTAQAMEDTQEELSLVLENDIVLATLQASAVTVAQVDPADFLIAGMEEHARMIEERLEEIEAQKLALIRAANRYEITEQERNLLHKAVMAEARGESYEGQMMIAQCILDGARRNNFDIATAIGRYRIATVNVTPSESVKNAVSAVFDDGERVTQEKADLWYAYELVNSGWHERQQYVTTIGVHRFFWCNTDMA